jgi:hypothetical protein
MSPNRNRFSLLICVLFFASGLLFAQNAEVSGVVRDSSQAAIPNAEVEIESTVTHVKWDTRANGSGVYTAASLPPDTYRLTVRAPGFAQQVVEPLKVDVAAKVSLDVTLKVGNEAQTISVNASGLQINTTDGTVSTVIDRKFVENIPLNGRSFQSLLTAVPGVTVVPSNRGQGFGGELTVNGMRTEANYYTVDGVSVNTGAAPSTPGWGAGFAGSTPSQSVLGTTQSLISIEALQELRAATSTYSAEYGRTPGGQFSFSSRSGSNDLHGSVFDYFRNDALDATDWFTRNAGLEKPRTRQNDFGGTFGGPVRIPKVYNGQDRTFFFFSYEGLRLRSPQSAVTTVVPGPTMRTTAPNELRQFLNAFPISSQAEDPTTGLAPYIAAYSNPSSLDATSVRIDHSFSDRIKFFARYSNSPSSTESRSANDLANVTRYTGTVNSGTTGLTWLISPRFVNDLRFNMTNTRQVSASTIDSFGGATSFSTAGLPGYPGTPGDWLDFYLYYDLRAYYATSTQSIDQRQANIVDTMTASLGRHSFKFGFDFRRIHSVQPLPGVYSFPMYFDPSELYANSPDWSALEKFSGAISPVYYNYSSFLQDEWKVNDRLSLSLGVRWDINPAPHDASGNNPYTVTQLNDLATTTIAPRGTALWATRFGNVSPRLGFAYRLGRSTAHQSVIRGGFGTYYDMGNVAGSMGYFGLGIAALEGGSGTPFPFTQSAVDALSVSAASPYNFSVYGFDPHLRSPYSRQWNVAFEQGLGAHQTLTVNYVGSQGKNLLATRSTDPSTLGNENFALGQGLYTITNDASSNYNGLQVRYQQTLNHGLQLLGSYTWSHAIDNASSNFLLDYLQRGDSSYDIRHNAQISLTYALPSVGTGFVRSVTKDWGIDARASLRSALPVDIVTGQTFLSNGSSVSLHPNRVSGQPLYLTDGGAPGGRLVNFNAFSPATDADGNPVEGNVGRNAARAFNAVQADVAVRRDFSLTERLRLQFRMEAFNIFNHPIFGSVYGDMSLGADNFGRAYNLQNSQLGGLNSLYQVGGPRSLQASIKLHF